MTSRPGSEAKDDFGPHDTQPTGPAADTGAFSEGKHFPDAPVAKPQPPKANGPKLG